MTPTLVTQPMPLTPDLPVPDPLHALAASTGFASDRLCFAARQSGLYRSSDGGDTWEPALAGSSGSVAPTVTCVAFAAAGGSGETVFAGALGGVMRSRDGGDTWKVTVLPSPPPLVACLVVSPAFAEDGIVFVGTFEDGIIRSNDRGETWRRWNFALLDLGVLALAISPAFATDETLYAGTETGIFVSTNGGRAWKETPFPEDAAPILALAVSPGFAADGAVWAGTEHQGLWHSVDRGASWARVDAGRVDGAVNQIVLAPSGRPEDGLIVALPEAVLVSRDGGRSWSVVAEDASGGGIAAVAAPAGLAPGAHLLVGLRDGSVRQVVMCE